jgi:guanylate kinase
MVKETGPETQQPANLLGQPLLVVLSGPSGVGKDTVLSGLKKLGYSFEHIITVTTRPQRTKERNNVDYHFISTEKFQDMISEGKLLEWANVYGNWYGVPKEPVKQALDSGQDVIVKTDVQGADTIKKTVPEAILIFLITPSMEELDIRLKQRHTESSFDFALRTKIAGEEMKQLPLFDYIVVNKQDEIAQAVSDIKAIIKAEKCRVNSRRIAL